MTIQADQFDEIEAALLAVQAAVADLPKSGSSLGSSIEAIRTNAKEALDGVRSARQVVQS